MKTRFSIAVLPLLILLLPQLEAGVIPGVWAKVEDIPEGYPVVVSLQGGEKLNGYFGFCGLDEITVRDEMEIERTIPKSHVVKISSKKRTENDGIADGIATGALAGALISLPAAVALSSQGWNLGRPVSAMLLGAGIGAGVGAATDAVIKAPEVFYRAPKD